MDKLTASATWLRSRSAADGALAGRRIAGASFGTLAGRRRARFVGGAGTILPGCWRMRRDNTLLKHSAHSLVWQHWQLLLLTKQISLCWTKVHQASWHKITFGAFGPKLLYHSPWHPLVSVHFQKSVGDVQNVVSFCVGSPSEFWPDLDWKIGMVAI